MFVKDLTKTLFVLSVSPDTVIVPYDFVSFPKSIVVRTLIFGWFSNKVHGHFYK